MLTGSASKGKTAYHYYYHCTSKCGLRFKAGLANDIFVDVLKTFIPKLAALEIYTSAIISDFKETTKGQDRERRQIISERENISKRMQNARIMRVDGQLDDKDFKRLKQESNKREAELEKQLGNLSGKYSEMGNLLETGLKKLSGLAKLYENGSVSEKREIVSSIFPENLVFDGMRYRTLRINEVVRLIYQKTSDLSSKKMGQIFWK
ncbi:hypothetical protein [Dyadobacter sp. CY312]|uniref:hypothetical protein n=1 Tax=Dyadobacter sp. CY312 TaxID=2907303 RepID=UPI001F215C4B|nr:hypothetical protein [Dyadobacter sp. CY312]MCE7039119.1 hypothetical protein [Dyadobacter sp. CY312]